MPHKLDVPKIITQQQEEGLRKKVLIIKPGYSETFDPDNSGIVSLGDILRSTVILHLFPPEEYHVTWLLAQEGTLLIKENPYVHSILKINPFTPFHLTNEWFDIVINLEKDAGICAMADRIPAWRRYGFRFVPNTDNVHAYDYADEALDVIKNPDVKRSHKKSWSETLYGILGQTYNKQPYILGYKPKTEVVHDVGLNHLVGTKFPIKKWPMDNWYQLEGKISDRYSVSWQQSANDLAGYIDWINSCKLIVTNDSLGLHIALALNKKVVAMFGSTNSNEIDDWDTMVKLNPTPKKECQPCLRGDICTNPPNCIEDIKLCEVIDAIDKLFQV